MISRLHGMQGQAPQAVAPPPPFRSSVGTPLASAHCDEHPVGPLPPARDPCPLSPPPDISPRASSSPGCWPLLFLLTSTLHALPLTSPRRSWGRAGRR